ncbi:bifunctional sulfate adenylyltransferase/adenylylsulfate kinase [Candidatus Zixiibacteriota bacterium]
MPDHLIKPYGGRLVDLIVSEERAAELKGLSLEWPSWDLNDRQLCDLELLLNGGFSPLTTFLGQADYESVLNNMRLADGTLWPIPIVLDVTEEFFSSVDAGDSIALRDSEGAMLAALHIREVWSPDRELEAEKVYGSSALHHPGVAHILNGTNPYYITGQLEGIQLPSHYDYRELRLTPSELRTFFNKSGWQRVVAFQTRNPMHRVHVELTKSAIREVDASLLIHPVVGPSKPGDLDHFTRVRCYKAIQSRYPERHVTLSLLPFSMRFAGPREALLHAIIHKNYGCTHLIVGWDHAGPGPDLSGKPYYGPYEAQQVFQEHEAELDISMVPSPKMVFLEEEDAFIAEKKIPEGKTTLCLTVTDIRRRLADGQEIPDWYSFPEVTKELRSNHTPRHKQGLTIFLTGYSGAGKSTIARILQVKFLEMGGRPVTLLDGDIVRRNLSSELGFSREHRDLNILRIGFVASEITKNGGIAICAPIAPYDHVRKANRALIESVGGYQLIHVSTPLDICEGRDRKGLYAKARAGIIKEFTGISDPYEEPDDADLTIDTTKLNAEEAVQRILQHLGKEGYIGASTRDY